MFLASQGLGGQLIPTAGLGSSVTAEPEVVQGMGPGFQIVVDPKDIERRDRRLMLAALLLSEDF